MPICTDFRSKQPSSAKRFYTFRTTFWQKLFHGESPGKWYLFWFLIIRPKYSFYVLKLRPLLWYHSKTSKSKVFAVASVRKQKCRTEVTFELLRRYSNLKTWLLFHLYDFDFYNPYLLVVSSISEEKVLKNYPSMARTAFGLERRSTSLRASSS